MNAQAPGSDAQSRGRGGGGRRAGVGRMSLTPARISPIHARPRAVSIMRLAGAARQLADCGAALHDSWRDGGGDEGPFGGAAPRHLATMRPWVDPAALVRSPALQGPGNAVRLVAPQPGVPELRRCLRAPASAPVPARGAEAAFYSGLETGTGLRIRLHAGLACWIKNGREGEETSKGDEGAPGGSSRHEIRS